MDEIKYVDGDSNKQVKVLGTWLLWTVRFAYCELLYSWGYDNIEVDRLHTEPTVQECDASKAP